MKLGTRRGAVEGSALHPGTGNVGWMFHESPLASRTLGAIWDAALRNGGNSPFLRFNGGQWLSYTELEAIIEKWERIAASFELARGTCVGVMLPNSPEFIGIYFALARIGLVSVPINTGHTGQMLEYVLADSRAELVIAAAEFADRFETGWELSDLRHMVVVGDYAGGGGEGRAVRSAAEIESETAARPIVRPTVMPSDTASILYTSGTTGPAKGVIQTHEYFAFYGWQFAYQFAYTGEDILMTALPLFHVNAQCATMLPALLSGAKMALYDRFSATRFWEQIAECGATHFAGMGAMANILLKRDPSEFRPDHKLRICQLVPAPDHLEEFEARFGVPVVYQMHGMTEGMFVLPTHYPDRRPGRIGQETPYHEVIVVDDDDREVGAGVEGELVVRPLLPNIMAREYLRKPEETLKATANLWFHTGDLVYRDEAGDLWFAGRKKDAMRRRGENISAFEVEREVLAHPKVLEVAAIGVPSDLGEDEVKIDVVAAGGLTEAELHAFCKSRMAGFMVPRYIQFRSELPKNQSQKILKHELKAEGVTAATWDAENSGRATSAA